MELKSSNNIWILIFAKYFKFSRIWKNVKSNDIIEDLQIINEKYPTCFPVLLNEKYPTCFPVLLIEIQE